MAITDAQSIMLPVLELAGETISSKFAMRSIAWMTESGSRTRRAVLAAMGLTVSDAVRLLLAKVAQEKALPFAQLIPNAVTIEAMKAARRGKLKRFGNVQELLDGLHADD